MLGSATAAILAPHLVSPPPSGFVLDSGLPAAAAAYSTRRLVTAYTANKAIRLHRASDSTEIDIGFDGSGNLDTASIATFCSGTSGYISKWYDQSGNGRDLIQATVAQMYSIYSGGAVETINSLPAARCLDATRGMVTAAFTGYTGSVVSGTVVANLSSGTSAFGPRYISLLPTALNDIDPQGAQLLKRDGGPTPTNNWGINRGNVTPDEVVNAGIYGTLQQITAEINGASYSLVVDGSSASGSSAQSAFNFTRIALGYSGSAWLSSSNEYLSEVIVFFSGLTATNRSVIGPNQATYFGTAPQGSGGTGGGTGGTDQDVPVAPGTFNSTTGQYANGRTVNTSWATVLSEDFNTGHASSWSNSGGSTDSVASGPNTADWGLYGPPVKNSDGSYQNNGNEGIGQRWPHNDIINGSTSELHQDVWSSTSQSAGMSGYPHAQKYGRWSVKARQDVGQGAGPCILLWPATGTWPNAGEIDILESPEGTCTKAHFTCHIGANNTQTGTTVTLDISQWHVYTLIWTSQYIDYYIDSIRWFHLTDLSFQPPNAMWLGIQNDLGAAGHFIQPPNTQTPQPTSFHIDWVRIYS